MEIIRTLVGGVSCYLKAKESDLSASPSPPFNALIGCCEN
jgi:hypothetical protein